MDTLAVITRLRAETQRLADAEAPASAWRAQRLQECAALDALVGALVTLTDDMGFDAYMDRDVTDFINEADHERDLREGTDTAYSLARVRCVLAAVA